jgi:SAM-dependent methyltransferase
LAGGTAFREELFDLAYPEGVGRHFWNLARNHIVRRKLLSGGLPGGAVLDVGCGRGATVQYLRAAGLDCLGVELAPTRIEPGLRPHVTTGIPAEALPAATRERVGSVLLLDVLEHLDDPEGLLRSLPRAFPGLRRVVVTVPARRELWSNYDDVYGHRVRHDLSSLRRLVSVLDPRRLAAGYFFHALYPVVRARLRLSGRRSVEVRAPRHPRVHRVLAAGFAAEERWLPASWPGSSAWAVADLDPAGSAG